MVVLSQNDSSLFPSILTSIAYRLHFVHVIIVDNVIEGGVELVEEVHDLVGSAGTRQLSEADNIAVTGELYSVSRLMHITKQSACSITMYRKIIFT